MCCKLLKMQNFTEILVLKKDLIYIQVAKRGEPFPPGFKKEKVFFLYFNPGGRVPIKMEPRQKP